MENLKDTENFGMTFKEGENLENFLAKFTSFMERRIFNRTSKRVNFLLTRINDQKLELIADGNSDKDEDGNWRFFLDSNGDLVIQTRLSGTWTSYIRVDTTGITYIGDAGVTNYLQIDSDADTKFVGGAGFPFGSFWGNEIAFVTAGGTGTYTEIADANITVGQTHNTTFQNNKELAVTFAGMYKIEWSMSVKGTGANKHIVGGIGMDAGGAGSLTIQNDGRNHAVSTGNAEFTLSGMAILDLSANSEVGLMVTNETDNSNITVEHVNISILQVGGT